MKLCKTKQDYAQRCQTQKTSMCIEDSVVELHVGVDVVHVKINNVLTDSVGLLEEVDVHVKGNNFLTD